MLEFAQTTVEIKIADKVYKMRVPTYKESLDYQQITKNIIGDEMALFEAVCNYFEMLGLPKDATANLEMGHLSQVLEFLLDTKKK